MAEEEVTAVNLVVRSWDKSGGLAERIETFQSLNEFFAGCLQIENPELIDRVILIGTDAAGKERVLTFVFQSVTVDRS